MIMLFVVLAQKYLAIAIVAQENKIKSILCVSLVEKKCPQLRK